MSNALGEIAGVIWHGLMGAGAGLLLLGLVGLITGWLYHDELDDWKGHDQ